MTKVRALTTDDDNFHAPTDDDPWWSESTWFTFMVPERRLYGYVYPWVRANQGLLGGGVMVWDDRGRHPWDALHWDYHWNFPYPELGDLRDITFPTGISITAVEPLHTYRVVYEHESLSLDVMFEALFEPHVLGGARDSTGTFAMHLDQQGRVTGRLTVGAEDVAIDCYAIRDRSWGRRVPVPDMHIGYDIATGPATAFIVFSNPDAPGQPVVGGMGYLWQDGVRAALTSGSRILERDGVWPRRVIVRATDASGRQLDATGECVNWMAFQNTPRMMNLVSLVRWEVEVATGTVELWGELADVWDVETYRRFARGTI